MTEIEKARAKRDGLGTIGVSALKGWGLAGADFFRSGALAAGTQIAPLNDVDLVVHADEIRHEWQDTPRRALEDLCAALERHGLDCTISAHAVKVTFADVSFTADVVLGCSHSDHDGHWIPHCPEDEPHCWIETHPKEHARRIRKRNAAIGNDFAREIRLLKALVRRWALRHGRKPLSSHHLSALALTVIHDPVDYATTTPAFLERASTLVLSPLRDPSGVGPDLEAKDPYLASTLMRDAAEQTRRALLPGADVEEILRDVFGDPAATVAAATGKPLFVGAGGLLSANGGRAVGSGRDYGDADAS